MWTLKYDTNEHLQNRKQTHRHIENKRGCQGGEVEGERGGGGMDWEIEVSRCKLLYREGINNILL